jgi:alpha-amylase/alpha-mannosidase (GH57 family)
MERFICIHGHFYQPPRENAWLETVELQDSAYPYHDWNERITTECYGPNAFARILDGDGHIARIVNNYSCISFNFGPTLLSWLAEQAPAVHAAIVEADRRSRERYSGHGNGLAQAYNHMILPLANRRDKATQIAWGVRDFEHRFGRPPEGMWLPETAVDTESLDLLAEAGIRFTILAPSQAKAVRPIGQEPWEDVSGGRVDPTMPYLCKLPSGRSIALFFYDGPISRAVAFEHLLTKGETFAARLMTGFSTARTGAQLVHIATDGESYGHHHPHGDMGLAFALHQIENDPNVNLTNYGEFLEKHPPTHEVEILENTAWSCVHGVDRWRRDCGCNSGRAGWNQAWREPLRNALDSLRDRLAPSFEKKAAEFVKDPWAARSDYVGIILDRSVASIAHFVQTHAVRELAERDRTTLLKLMELQRHAMLMYTSCGWFFDELSGLETVQVIQYAGRAIQLGRELFGEDFEAPFLGQLGKAKSNIPEQRDGRLVYEKHVKPAMVDWARVAAHFAVSSLFSEYPAQARVFCYNALSEDFQTLEAGKARLVVGRVKLASEITRDSEQVEFGVLHFGDHNINGGCRKQESPEKFQALAKDLAAAFAKADFPEIVRVMDRGFGQSTYSLRSLFRDEQRAITRRILQPTLDEVEAVYRKLYEDHLPTMRFLADLGVPLPRAFQAALEFVVNSDLGRAYRDGDPDLPYLRQLLEEANRWHVPLDTQGLGYRLKVTTERVARRFHDKADDGGQLETLQGLAQFVRTLPFEVDLWQPQNTYFEMLQSVYPQHEARIAQGDAGARDWADRFLALGETLGIQVTALKKK